MLIVAERRRCFRRPLAVPPFPAPRKTLLKVQVPLVTPRPLRRHASRQLRYLPPRPPLQIGHLQVQPFVGLIYVRLQLRLVPLQLRLHVPEEGGAVARVPHPHGPLSDISRQVQVILLPPAQRVRRQRVQTRLGKRFRIGIVMAPVGGPLSAHHGLLEVDLVLLTRRFVLLFLLLPATVPAPAGPTTGLLSLLLVLAPALPVDLVGQSRRRRLLLATLAPGSALASRFTDYLQYLGEVLAPRYVLRGLPLLVPQATVAARLQQDPRQLSTSHRRRDVQRRVAVLPHIRNNVYQMLLENV